jgi:hypothetical protein
MAMHSAARSSPPALSRRQRCRQVAEVNLKRGDQRPAGTNGIGLSPDGAGVTPHRVPDMLVTNLCFGGPEFRTAYVTMSCEDRPYQMQWHEPGLAVAYG